MENPETFLYCFPWDSSDMKNLEVAKLLYEIADLLEMQEVEFKPRAYKRAAQQIEAMTEDIVELWKKGRLQDIPGVGEGIAKKIDEFLRTGKLNYYEKLKKQMPMDVEELMNLPGLGPKKIKLLYQKLKIRNVKDLEQAAKQGRIAKIKGMGEKTQQEMLENIQAAWKKETRMLLGRAFPIAEEIKNALEAQKEVVKVDIAGSFRRMKETIGDIDILCLSKNPKATTQYFTSMKEVADILAKGETKSSVRLHNGLQIDLRMVEPKSYGAALLYFTGSKQHNIELRKIALKHKWKLNEYGLFQKNKLIAGKTEEEVYKKLGMQYIEPEMRENTGEIDVALKKKLPRLIGYGDIKGDLQMHTQWSDGHNTIEEMARAAKALGYEYIAITDHTGTLAIAHGLDEERMREHMKEVERVNERVPGIKVLKGCEVNILKDGSLDLKAAVLKDLDIVVASIHSGFKQSKETIMKRMVAAMENEHVDIIAHPTGRRLGDRKGYEVDFEKLFEAAKKTETLLEINAFPERLDLNDVNARAAIQAGCKVVIDTDSHDTMHLPFMKFGIATARRAWAEKKNIINTLSWKEFKKYRKIP